MELMTPHLHLLSCFPVSTNTLARLYCLLFFCTRCLCVEAFTSLSKLLDFDLRSTDTKLDRTYLLSYR